jgi:outer membrane protein OmpA-like peptidoglycan-associated protein
VRFIEFEFGISELSGHAMRQLDAFAKFLNERPALTLGIEGSADRRMDRIDNQAIDDKRLNMLALTRANTVKNYLVQNGKVAAGRLQLKPAKIMATTDGDYSRVELHLSGR